jgi:hypothetical protein
MAVDPLGPEPPEDEKKATNGKPNGEEKGGSVSDQAKNEVPDIPPPPPLPGDKQMTLGSLGKRGTPVENRVSLMAASTEADGLFDPESEGQLLVSYEPADYDYKPVRKDGKVVRWKLIQSLRVVSVTKVTPEMASAIQAVLEEHELEPTPA